MRAEELERLRVGDLIDVPHVETVVRLDERRRPETRARLVATFVPTEEARRVVGAVLRRLGAAAGSVFVVGGYGSGKSHLLAVLAEAGEREPLASAARLLGEAGGVTLAPPPLAVEASLVAQAAERDLEAILLEAVGVALGAPLEARATRPERWRAAAEAARAAGHGGLLLLVDELSSFLRAKPTRAALREDVRLLQYLGEYRESPLCVVATMQETIEAAAQPEPEVSQRLRDRFATLRLSGAHLEAVVAERLLHRRTGADEAIAALRGQLVEALGALPSTAERFDRLYPVYPPTLDHLDAMRHHLSAARGALDFVYSHLVGDPDHGLAPLLEAPATTLLTPDALFSHFATRLSETPETAPLVERVAALYRVEAERLFGAGDAPLARRVADYLCVEAAGVRPRPRSAEEVARDLAVRGTRLDPGLGRARVEELLERMTQAGAYVVATGERPSRRYAVDQEADSALVVERRLAALTAKEGEADESGIVERVLSLVGDDPALPLATLRRERESLRTIAWERGERRGTVWFGPLDEVTAEDLDAWLDSVERPDHDFVLAIGQPGGAARTERSRSALERLIARAGDAPGARALLWWVPAPLADLAPLLRLDALATLAAELEAVASDASARALEVVREERRALAPRVARLLVDSLYGGEVVLGQGDTMGRPEGLRVLGFGAVVEHLGASALALRHPDHRLVMARGESVPESAEEALYAHFLPDGESEAGLGPAPLALLEGVLVPLGLAERRGRAYRLVTEPGRSPALAALAGVLAARRDGPLAQVTLTEIRHALAKGRLGLEARAIRLTVAAAVFGGLATPVTGGRRVPLGRLSGPEAVDRLEALRPGGGGEGGRVPASLSRLPFLAEGADGPYLPAKQRELWARAVKWKAERGDPAAEAEALRDLARHPVLRAWTLDGAVEALAASGRIAAAIAVSLPPGEGLGRLERQSAEEGEGIAAALAAADAWSSFVRTEMRTLLEADRYLGHPALLALADEGPEVAALAEERRRLAERLRTAPGLLEAAERIAWRETYERFVDAYRGRYVAAHRSAVAEDPVPALMALERQEPRAAADPRARSARAALLSRYCTLSPARALDVEPICPCGYRIGSPPLTHGIAAYADLLKTIAAEPVAVAPASASAESGAVAPPPAGSDAPSTAVAPPPVAGAAQRQGAVTAAGTGPRRRSLAALMESLGGAGAILPGEARRRFERWLDAEDGQPVVIEP